jgi:hypothetical protein
MQLKCPSGHVRSKQGLHAMSSFAMIAAGDMGGVKAGVLDP